MASTYASPTQHRIGAFDDQGIVDGWSLLPLLFDAWDMDGNGFVDLRELLSGLRRYCRSKNLLLNRQRVVEIVLLVDSNRDRQLDLREFSVFMARFAATMGAPLLDLTHSIMAQLTERNQLSQNLGLRNPAGTLCFLLKKLVDNLEEEI